MLRLYDILCKKNELESPQHSNPGLVTRWSSFLWRSRNWAISVAVATSQWGPLVLSVDLAPYRRSIFTILTKPDLTAMWGDVWPLLSASCTSQLPF